MAPMSKDGVALDLATEVARSFGSLRFAAYGASMLPAIFPGDILQVRREAVDEFQAGDVVLFSRDSRFFAHRVICVEHNCDELTLIVRGDALATEDPPVHSAEILGRVVSLERDGKLIAASRKQSLWRSILAWAMRRSDSLVSATLRLHSLRTRITRRAASRGTPSVQESF